MIGLKLGLGLSGGQTGLNRYRIGTSMPALILDHARGFYAEGTPPVRDGFSDLVAFTRASEGYALDADGIWQKSLTNVPRFDWSTGKWAQLIEAAATNHITNSNTLSGWVAVAVTPSDDGGGVTRVTPNTDSTIHEIGLSGFTSWPDNGLFTCSVEVKITNPDVFKFVRLYTRTKTPDFPGVYVDLTTGAKTDDAAPYKTTVTDRGDGWWRVSVTANAATGSGAARFGLVASTAENSSGASFAGDGIAAFLVRFPQAEAGEIATSPISTSGTAATRAADLTSKDLSGYDFSSGITVSFEGNLGAVVGGWDRVIELSDGTSNNTISIMFNAGVGEIRFGITAGGVSQATGNVGVGLSADFKLAISVAATGAVVVALDGVTKLSVSGKTKPAISMAGVGMDVGGSNIPASLHHYETLIKEGPSTEVALKALTA